jgi:glycine/D-amino acid oxidase-like deaminating enzyme
MNGNVRTTDCVILGAGVMGTAIAFQLAKRGGHPPFRQAGSPRAI